jgi:hypothetical protein
MHPQQQTHESCTFWKTRHSNKMPKVKESKRGATGRVLGKAAKRSRTKNAAVVEDYLHALESVETSDDLNRLSKEHGLMLARVVRPQGMGRLEVRLQDGTAGLSVPIAGAVKFRGGAATKADLDHCMSTGDLIVLRGCQAAGKIRLSTAAIIREHFVKHRLPVVADFFASEGTDDDDIFDRTGTDTDADVDIDEV